MYAYADSAFILYVHTMYLNQFLNSYAGDHYSLNQLGQVSLHFNYTDDGLMWKPIGNSPFYIGGISEVGEYFKCDYILTYFLPSFLGFFLKKGWAFDNDRVIWGVGRNEDGDDTGNN